MPKPQNGLKFLRLQQTFRRSGVEMFRKILVAVDLEEGTEGVIRCVADMANRYEGCQILLAYVAELPLLTLSGGKGSLELAEEDVAAVDRAAVAIRKLARDRLEDLVQMTGLQAQIQILDGPPVARTLVNLATAEEADLLVVGSHHKGKIKRIILGSVSDKIAHEAPCPVLIVKPPFDPRGPKGPKKTRRMPESGGGL